MRIRDLMMTGVQSCRPEDTLADATAWIWKSDSDGLAVTDWEDRLVGRVSDRDVQATLEHAGRMATDIQVSEAMSHDVTACSPDEKVSEAFHLMRASGLTWLPVIDRDKKVLGILSAKSLLKRRESGDEIGIPENELLAFSYGDY